MEKSQSNIEETEKEKKKLKEVLKEVERELKEAEATFDNLEKHTQDEFLLYILGKTYSTKIRNMKKAMLNPYFARIDFKEENQKDKQKIYIGKSNIFDEESNVIVADWRAPISNIYYDGEIGEAEYNCPEGTIKGELLLKRQYTIDNAELIQYNDIDITTNDELLGKVLNENSDVRLKNIVSTIQKEQNKIIRSNMATPLIVQGVAGSGKTTVAIHRIAYLIYTYENEIKPEEFLIIAPNKFFLGYIKNSLPDLGIDYVNQQTFEDFALGVIKEKITVENSNKKLIEIINNSENEYEKKLLIKESEFKSSLEFKECIDKYLLELNETFLPNENFKIAEITIIEYSELKSIFLDSYDRFSLKDRVERLQNYMKNKVENLSETIIDKITEKRKEKLNRINQNISLEEQQNIRKEIFEETEYEINSLLKNKGNKLIIDYIKKLKIPSIIETYKNIIKNKELYFQIIDDEVYEYLNRITLSKLNKKNVEFEDLAGILHLKYKIKGIEKNIQLKHIVIDEAQDFGEFQFYSLNEVMAYNKSLTILGDISQGIYDYRGTNNWNRINEMVFSNEAKIEYLRQSYRTTKEIMDEANKILAKKMNELKVILANPISRSGENVNYYTTNSNEEKSKLLEERIKYAKEKGLSNIAIISKTEETCSEIYNRLKNKFDNIQIITEASNNYGGGITVVPSYYSKGLEFDSVIIADYKAYTDSLLDTKLLYVAMTRAMHLLDVIE